MADLRVLIVSYYWPPAGGPGVQRWLKFVKYLPEFGVEPIVYIPENPSYPIVDESLTREVNPNLKVIKTKIWEPYRLAEKINPTNKKYKSGQFDSLKEQSLLSKLSVFVRGNFFIPDARKFWIKPSIAYLNDYLKENPVDVLITTGPPHSLHLIGLGLKEKHHDLKWLADFRDPWTTISYHNSLQLTQKSKKKHLELERKVMETADLVLATGFTDATKYVDLGAKRVEVLTNGYEENDFERLQKQKSERFKLVYSGGLEQARNPVMVWKALNELIKENQNFAEDFKLEFYGNLSSEVENSILENGLDKYLDKKGYVSHKESIRGIINADLLLLTNFPNEQSKGILPGKIFEYMATENPILAIGPKSGDVQEILKDYEVGTYFEHIDFVGIKQYVLIVYSNWKIGEKLPVNQSYKRFSRRNLTEKLNQLLRN